jgi:hypothetical protein
MCVLRNNEARAERIVVAEEQYVSHNVRVYFYSCVSGIKCACAILSSVLCSALQCSSVLSHKRHDIRKKIIEHKMCVLNFSTTFVRNISHSKKR